MRSTRLSFLGVSIGIIAVVLSPWIGGNSTTLGVLLGVAIGALGMLLLVFDREFWTESGQPKVANLLSKASLLAFLVTGAAIFGDGFLGWGAWAESIQRYGGMLFILCAVSSAVITALSNRGN